jgi:hypothetical protein
VTRRYRLRNRWGWAVVGIGFFGACGALFLHLAAGGEHGIRIARIVELDPGAAAIVWWLLAGLSLGMAGLGAFGSIALRARPREIVLDDDTLTVPRTLAWWRPPRTIRLAEIRQVRRQVVQGERFLTLVTPTAKVWVGGGLIGEHELEEISRLIEARRSS